MKQKQVEGHLFVGWTRRGPYNIEDGLCSCGATFSSKTRPRMRAMQKDHASDVMEMWQTKEQFGLIIAWATRDQEECLRLAENKNEKTEAEANLKIIAAADGKIGNILAREAR